MNLHGSYSKTVGFKSLESNELAKAASSSDSLDSWSESESNESNELAAFASSFDSLDSWSWIQ